MEFDKFCKLISKIENIPLPAETSQLKMSPPFREALQERQKHMIKDAKRAGVMALFYPNNEQTYLVLILRKTYKGVHSAQVGFPGGKLEEADASIEAAAVRETFEEVGVPENCIEVLRQLTQVYIPPSNFFVQPFIGISRMTPSFIKQDDEVEDILEITLQDFINDINVVQKKVATSYNRDVLVPAFNLNGHIVWGATAMMLSEIKDLLKQVM
ncbi:NUDIX hydrolase [Xanthomarina spongicola]|uniref:NUDIX domain-containing protein n=1 Tax=Xanthomarina spongicola TaxID=570520 RepID=A0A316DGK2_9FLAO|nr:CoA pyrophosphatase [Xanthomarina spongicola]PWK17264.1 NUDIX domain-containing protein [Xanthomarina spongicola]